MQTANNNKPVKPEHRIDPKVIITMASVALISLIIFGFRFATRTTCKNVDFTIQSPNSLDSLHFYTETPLSFNSNAQKRDVCEWSFGTADGKKATGRTATFTYTEPGQYLVGLKVNGECDKYLFINISKARRMVNPALIPRLICPQTIELGKPTTFKDSTAAATTWEWRFGESGQIDAITKTATYLFKTPGVKTVTLIINGNPDAYATCQVFVNQKETAKTDPNANPGNILLPPIDEKPKSDPLSTSGDKVTISDDDFKGLIGKVVKGQKFPSDFIPYMCGGNIQMPVNYKVTGDKQKTMSFELVCRDLEDMKEHKIKSIQVSLTRDPVTNCINGMTIIVSKKKFL